MWCRSRTCYIFAWTCTICFSDQFYFYACFVCYARTWTMPQYKCYWKVAEPNTKVAVAFGLAAARKYGTDMSLWQGLQGKGNVYGTLLREGTTALLNSYNSIHFSYTTLSVVGRMNWALTSSPQQALITALRFKRANSGGGKVRCNLTPCKWFLCIWGLILGWERSFYSCLYVHKKIFFTLWNESFVVCGWMKKNSCYCLYIMRV